MQSDLYDYREIAKNASAYVSLLVFLIRSSRPWNYLQSWSLHVPFPAVYTVDDRGYDHNCINRNRKTFSLFIRMCCVIESRISESLTVIISFIRDANAKTI